MTQTPVKSNIVVKEKEVLYKGFLKLFRYIIDIPRFDGGMMHGVSREVVERNPASGALLFDPIKEQCVLIEQFRIGAFDESGDKSPWILEVVAGLADKEGESPESLLMREAKEEAGCDVLGLMPIQQYLLGPGLTNEKIHLYLGFVDSSDVGGVHGVDDEAEDIKAHVLTMPELKAHYQEGKLNNGMTLISVQWLLLNYDTVLKAGKELMA